jgi:hypothetical protein
MQPDVYTNRVIYTLFCDAVLRRIMFTATFSVCLKLLRTTVELTPVSSRIQSVVPRNCLVLGHETAYIYALYAYMYFCVFKISTVKTTKRRASFQLSSNGKWSDSQQRRRDGPSEFCRHSDTKM